MSQPMSTQVETLYRAKKLYSSEWVEGCLNKQIFEGHSYYGITNINDDSQVAIKIDKSTLAIHFTNSNMEDSEGTPIFASLSSDGNGGDYELLHGIKWIVKFHRLSLRVVSENKNMEHYLEKTHFKVTGIYTTDKE